MVVGEWRLPAAGQGGVCAGTLGFLLDPGGGAMESYCGVGQSKARVSRRSQQGFGHLCFLKTEVTGTGSLLLALILEH